MGKLIYSMNVSLDGFVETPDHSLDWANVDDELHTWFFPALRAPIHLQQTEERRFGSGVVYLGYVAR